MPLVESTERLGQCAKPGCMERLTHRHHKGCETMWLTAFAGKKRQKQYKALERRYKKFRPKDVVEVCAAHHEEIHDLINLAIAAEVRRRGMVPTRLWSWEEAYSLMSRLRTLCDEWLQKETPGSPLKKFATSGVHDANASLPPAEY
jgi:hypothetical protein